MQAGWGTPTNPFTVLDVPNGTYTARIRVTQPYRDAFGVDITSATATVTVRVRTGTPQFGARLQSQPLTIAPRADGPSMRPGTQPNATTAAAPPDARPDLRSLPAWDLTTVHRRNRGDYLRFAANVWNAGPSPLVVDGFRQPGEPLMDAYQIFYDTDGNQVGTAPTGTLEYDTRSGHQHWHFTDFARYRILDADRRPVVLSGKEAFCLAPTDDIDLRVPGANWRPGQTGLATACGGQTALSIREVLDVGWGDTYAQFIPGQAFNITDLPNGRYFVEVTANPDGRLFETDMSNNTTLRRIRLGGTLGNRTVTALPFQGIAAP